MPTRKTSRSKSPKKSPSPKKRVTRSRSRSTSRSRVSNRETTTTKSETVVVRRSRSRSAGRRAIRDAKNKAAEIPQLEKAPPLPPRARTPRQSPPRVKKSAEAEAALATLRSRVKSKSDHIVSDVTRGGSNVDATDGKTTTTTWSDVAVVHENKSNNAMSPTSDGTARTIVSSRGEVPDSTKPAPTSHYTGFMYLLTILCAPLISYHVVLCCDEKLCQFFRIWPCPAQWSSFFNLNITMYSVVYYILNALIYMIPIGDVVHGQTLSDGTTRLSYRMNAWLAVLLNAAVVGFSIYRGCPLDYIEKNLLQFVTAGLMISFVITVYSWIRGRNVTGIDKTPGITGGVFEEFWNGKELNPRIGFLDLKFVATRTVIITWMIVIWYYVAAQFYNDGYVRPALLLLVACQTTYLLNLFVHESYILYSLDIGTQGFGYMVLFGVCSFMPFFYGQTVRYLYLNPDSGIQNNYCLLAIFALYIVGQVMFTGANGQKIEFRKNPYNPAFAHLSSIPTPTGKRLLCSGWWGICRRPNYLGDLIVAFTWSMICGFDGITPYMYPISLILLLVFRCIDDEKLLAKKYGSSWTQYTNTVKYRILPYVF